MAIGISPSVKRALEQWFHLQRTAAENRCAALQLHPPTRPIA
jgi:hypothetical protein